MKPLLFACVALLASVALGQSKEPEVFVDEIIRRGDMVEHVTNDIFDGAHIEDGGTDIRQVVDGMPASDRDKWHIYVVGQKGCEPCQKLVEAWKTDPTLRAYAKPDNQKESWANFQYFRYDDPLQAWRWTKSASNPNPLVIKSFPTIVCQPPRNGKWKDTDYVHSYGYAGDSQAWSKSLNTAIKFYVRKVNDAERRELAEKPVEGGHGAEPAIGQQVVPPNLPNDEPERPALLPNREHAGMRFGRETEKIVVVQDKNLKLAEEDAAAILVTVDAMQPKDGPKLPVYEIDLSEAKRYDVTADELPVVVKVTSRDKVLEKRNPKDEAPRGFVFSILALIFGAIAAAKMASWVGMAIGVLFLGVVVMVLALLGTLLYTKVIKPSLASQPAPAPNPAAPAVANETTAQAHTSMDARIAETKAQIEYEKLKAELKAAAAANA